MRLFSTLKMLMLLLLFALPLQVLKAQCTAYITSSGPTSFCPGGSTLLTAVSGPNVVAAAGGNYHSLFLKDDGTVWATGRNSNGQLGDGGIIDKSTPVMISRLSGVVSIAAGESHSLFLKNDGTAWAAGNNADGQLGDGSTIQKALPVQVSGLSGIIAIASGTNYSLFLKNDSTVWATGNNRWGQLGDGTTTNRTTPVQVSGLSGITAIAGGDGHSLFLKNDSTVWSVGYNSVGQLGDGTTTMTTIPVQVSGLSGITAIAGGFYHSLFLKKDGTVWATGFNFYGQLGDGTTTDKFTPVQSGGLSSINAISGGIYHSLFLKNDGTVWATGFNGFGQLGDGTTIQSLSPVQMNVTSGITEIAAGRNHSLVLKNDGTTLATGYNFYSQLGDGTTIDKSTPVLVSGLAVYVNYYNWYRNGQKIRGVVSATYTATLEGGYETVISYSNGCRGVSSAVTVTVISNTAGAQSSSPLVCVNSAFANITHATTGATGIGTSIGLPNGVSATWANDRITISGTPTEAGNFNYSIPLTGGCGNVSATGTITINVATTSTTDSSICSSALPFLWNGLTFNGAGSQTATLTNAAGCDSLATLNLNVITSANITTISAGINPICGGTRTILTANGVTGTNAVVTWYDAPGATGNIVGRGLTSDSVFVGTYYAVVTGDCGSPAEASFTIVNEAINPLITCPSNVSVNNINTLNCTQAVVLTVPIYSDNCKVKALSWTMTGATNRVSSLTGIRPITNTILNSGTTTITYTVRDFSNNSNTCSFIVAVSDVVKPSFTTAPTNITVTTTGCSSSINVPNVSFSDNCGTPSFTWVATGATTGNGNTQVGTLNFNLGTTTLTYTLTDANNNVRTASILVKVLAVISCPSNITTSTVGTNCTKNIATIAPTYANSCSFKSLTWSLTGATVLLSPLNGIWLANTKNFKAGLTTVKYTLTDFSGNSAFCTYNVQLNTTNTCPIANQAKSIVANEEATDLKAMLSPNPTTSLFALRVKSNSNAAVEVSVYNNEGKKIEQMKTANLNNILFGEKYTSGSYLIEVRQGDKRTTAIGVKQ